MQEMKNDLDRFSCQVYRYAESRNFNLALNYMERCKRVFNANASLSWEGCFLHHAIECVERRGNNYELLDFLIYYGADPKIRIDQSCNSPWPNYFSNCDGLNSIELAKRLLSLSDDHSTMKLLNGERNPIDLFHSGFTDQPMVQQIGPVPAPPKKVISKIIPILLISFWVLSVCRFGIAA